MSNDRTWRCKFVLISGVEFTAHSISRSHLTIPACWFSCSFSWSLVSLLCRCFWALSKSKWKNGSIEWWLRCMYVFILLDPGENMKKAMFKEYEAQFISGGETIQFIVDFDDIRKLYYQIKCIINQLALFWLHFNSSFSVHFWSGVSNLLTFKLRSDLSRNVPGWGLSRHSFPPCFFIQI